MKPKTKLFLTGVLLFFVGVTLTVQIVKEFRPVEPMQLAEGLNVVCTHATVRCPVCTTMERLTREMLDESFKDEVAAGKIVFREVNYEQPEVGAFAGEFRVATASVVLVNVQNGEVIARKNLANEAWKLYTNDTAFKHKLKEQIDAMLQGVTLDVDTKSQEIMIFDDTDDSSTDDTRPPYDLTESELDMKLGIDNSDELSKDYVGVIYFHIVPGCDTCQLMSQYIYETIAERFADDAKERRIVLRYRDMEDAENAELMKKLGIKSPSLAVIRIQDGKMTKAILAGQIWSHAADKAEFMDYIEEEIRWYLSELKDEQK